MQRPLPVSSATHDQKSALSASQGPSSVHALSLLKDRTLALYPGVPNLRQSPAHNICALVTGLSQACIACSIAVAVSQGAVKELLACCHEAVRQDGSCQASLPDLAVPAARALTAVLGSDSARDEFAEQEGATALQRLLEASEGLPSTQMASI